MCKFQNNQREITLKSTHSYFQDKLMISWIIHVSALKMISYRHAYLKKKPKPAEMWNEVQTSSTGESTRCQFGRGMSTEDA